MSRSHLLKVDSPNLMIYRPGRKAEYLRVNENTKLCADTRVEGQDGVFVVNTFLNHESRKICAIVHKNTGLCVTSSKTGQYIHMKNEIGDLNEQMVKLEPEEDRFFYFTASNESWLFEAMDKQDTYLTIENGEATLMHSVNPAIDVPGAFLKIVNPDKH